MMSHRWQHLRNQPQQRCHWKVRCRKGERAKTHLVPPLGIGIVDIVEGVFIDLSQPCLFTDCHQTVGIPFAVPSVKFMSKSVKHDLLEPSKNWKEPATLWIESLSSSVRSQKTGQDQSKHGIVFSYYTKDCDLWHLDHQSVKTTLLYVPLQRL